MSQILVTQRLANQLQRRTESASFTDTANYFAPPSLSVLDEYGQPTQTTQHTAVSCSFTDKPAVEKWTGYADIEEIAAEVRVSSITPAKGGRFTIISRFGNDVTEKTYEIVGIQDRGAFGYVCALKAVTI